MQRPKTPDGEIAWEILKSCERQLRVGFGSVYGIDFTAVLAFAGAMGAAVPLLLELLPEIERVIVWAWQRDNDG